MASHVLRRRRRPGTRLRRVAMISLHTSPARPAGHRRRRRHERLRHRARPGGSPQQGIEVDIFTRATSLARCRRSSRPRDGVLVHHVHAGPFEGLTKDELPGQLCVFAREVLRTEAAQPRPLRRRALPLLALRPGRGAGPRPLGHQPGDDVDRRPLRRQDQVDADRARHLRQPRRSIPRPRCSPPSSGRRARRSRRR